MKNRITPQKITKLAKNEIFIFGSNGLGNHAGGAAKLALDKFGAIQGCGYGLQGKSYAINTMDGIDIIKQGIINLIACANENVNKTFLVTEIGCGIAGFKPEQIAPLFEATKNIENIHLPQSFWDILNKPKTIKGYKVFGPDFKCLDYQFSEFSEHKFKGKIQMCGAGFHFCLKLGDCFSYYKFDKNNIVCEVEAIGDFETHNEDSKICTNHLKIGRKLTWEEVLFNANEGVDNTGYSNSGNRNSGDSNSGDSNSGDSNSGDRNSGNRNSGDSNSGDSNSGYRNSGNSNSGNWNSGNSNSGNWNSGNSNSGYRNSGYSNSGNWNSGNSNSGNRNSGYSNSGNRNSGYRNSGNRNSGYSNSGNWNSGNRNSGDSNSGYRNSGAFCTDENPILFLFNKPSKMTIKEWENSPAINLMYSINPTLWIPFSMMSKEEKEANPKAETTDGYLKTIPIKEAWKNAWDNWDTKARKTFTFLENFDSAIFEEITGIKI